MHHHLLGAPWRSWKPPLSRRTQTLAAFVDGGAELVVAGHVHQSAVAERREFEVVTGGERSAVVVTAPGLGQPRPKRRGEARGFHVYDAEADDAARADVRLARRGLGADRRPAVPARARAAGAAAGLAD